jgi:hypothetical protein
MSYVVLLPMTSAERVEEINLLRATLTQGFHPRLEGNPSEARFLNWKVTCDMRPPTVMLGYCAQRVNLHLGLERRVVRKTAF